MTNFQISLDNVTAVDKLDYQQLDKRYCNAHIICTGVAYLALMGLALLLLWMIDCLSASIAIDSALLAAAAINLLILPRAFHSKGYALRERDITYRRGLIFPKTTTIPYARIQQVNVTQNPVTRFFHLYSVEIVNGAQLISSMSIPGLTEDTANRIKVLITDKLTTGHD